jgi:hypothetical protein
VRNKEYLVLGFCLGFVMTTMMLVAVFTKIAFSTFLAVIISFVVIMGFSAYLVKQFSIKKLGFNPPIIYLVSVTILTFFPIFGSAAGGPDFGLEWLTLYLVGCVAGIIWSIPFTIFISDSTPGNPDS